LVSTHGKLPCQLIYNKIKTPDPTKTSKSIKNGHQDEQTHISASRKRAKIFDKSLLIRILKAADYYVRNAGKTFDFDANNASSG
jgi:hypothetical protein